MRKATSLLSTACLMVLLAPDAPAEDASPAGNDAQAAPAKSKVEEPERMAEADDPIVCRTQLETGSRVRKNKICMTKSEWEAHRRAARRYKESIDRSRSTQPGGESLGH